MENRNGTLILVYNTQRTDFRFSDFPIFRFPISDFQIFR